MPEPERRFPPPWSAEETDACFIVRDVNGHALGMSISRRSPAAAQRRSCSPATRRGASPLTSPSCRSCLRAAVGHQKLPAGFSGPARGLLCEDGLVPRVL